MISLRRPLALPVGGLLVLAIAAFVSGCDTRMGLQSPAISSVAPSASARVATSAQPSAPASPVVGVVTKVDSAGLDKVSGFTLRTNAGQSIEFTIGTLENGAQFPPGHLAEHLATAAPVRVWFRVDGGRLVVYRIEDAG